jgi:hypothetical protein
MRRARMITTTGRLSRKRSDPDRPDPELGKQLGLSPSDIRDGEAHRPGAG